MNSLVLIIGLLFLCIYIHTYIEIIQKDIKSLNASFSEVAKELKSMKEFKERELLARSLDISV